MCPIDQAAITDLDGLPGDVHSDLEADAWVVVASVAPLIPRARTTRSTVDNRTNAVMTFVVREPTASNDGRQGERGRWVDRDLAVDGMFR